MSPGTTLLRRFELFFLAPYQQEPLDVVTRLRILLFVLVAATAALLVAGVRPLLFHPSAAVRVLVGLLLVALPGLLWLLRRGRQGTVVFLFSVGLPILITVPQVLDYASGFSPYKMDRLTVQVIVQLVIISAISDRAAYLVCGLLIPTLGLAVERFVVEAPAAGPAQQLLTDTSVQSVVNLGLVFAVLVVVQSLFHRAIRQVEEANRTLEARVTERTNQLREAQFLLLESEKMTVTGLLTAKVAHHINNPLGAILASSYTIKTVLPETLDEASRLLLALTPAHQDALRRLLAARPAAFLESGLARREARQDLAATLSAWGIAHTGEMVEHLADAGIAELDDEWRPLLSGPLGARTCAFLANYRSVQRSGAIIDEASERAADFVAALQRSLSNQAASTPQVVVDPAASLEAVLLMIGFQLPESVVVKKDFEAGLGVLARPGRLLQALHNLISHVASAMTAAGTLTLGCRREGPLVVITATHTEPDGAAYGSDSLFDVLASDAAPGTAPGLVTARNIVQESGGTLTVETGPDQTTVYLRLPLA